VTPSEILQIGLSISLQPANLAFAFIGAVIGTLVGVLPGLGPAAALALLLPVSFGMSPVGAIIMLAGIYYGAQYGGSTTSILVNIPGEASSIVTCLDGYQMARRGDAGPALAMAAIGSFVAGTAGTLGLMLLAPPLVQFALSFGPPEYVGLIFLGFVTLTFMAQGSMLKALMMTAVGLFLSTVGLDEVSGVARFTFGVTEMLDGVDLVPAVMGLFGVSEVLINLEAGLRRQDVFAQKIRGVLPSREELRRSTGPVARGTLLGFLLGILPGGGSILSAFVSYAVEKRLSKHPERFGTGMIEGVAGPEAANNAGATGAFIPLLTLGLPTNAVPARHAQPPRHLLGRHLQHVRRQRHAARAEPPAHRPLGAAPARAVSAPVPPHPALLPDRGLQHREQPVEHLHDARHGPGRVLDAGDPLRGGAARGGARPGHAVRGGAPAVAHPVGRELRHLLHPAHRARADGGRPGAPRPRRRRRHPRPDAGPGLRRCGNLT
jgi:hypothetical protein